MYNPCNHYKYLNVSKGSKNIFQEVHALLSFSLNQTVLHTYHVLRYCHTTWPLTVAKILHNTVMLWLFMTFFGEHASTFDLKGKDVVSEI